MAQTFIKGIRIKSLTVDTKSAEGNGCVSADYALIGSTDKELAAGRVSNRQGYGEQPLQPAADTIAALNAFLALYKRDIASTIGIEIE